MDSPIVTQLFRRLFQHRGSQLLQSHSSLPHRIPRGCQRQTRQLASRPPTRRRKDDDGTLWRHRIDDFPRDMSTELKEYPLVTADELRARPQRPKRVKMLARDFIEGKDADPGNKHCIEFSFIFIFLG